MNCTYILKRGTTLTWLCFLLPIMACEPGASTEGTEPTEEVADTETIRTDRTTDVDPMPPGGGSPKNDVGGQADGGSVETEPGESDDSASDEQASTDGGSADDGSSTDGGSADDGSADDGSADGGPPELPPDLTLSIDGLPGDPSRDTTFSAIITSPGATHYRFQIMSGDQPCGDPAGYEAPVAITTPLNHALTSVADGTVTFCVVGGAGGHWASAADAFRFTWLKDTRPPVPQLSGALTGTSDVVAFAVDVMDADGLTHYRYKIGAAAATNCADDVDYSVETAEAVNIVTDISALSDGLIRLCVIGRDALGNELATADALDHTWTKDTLPLFTVSLASELLAGVARVVVDLPEDTSEYGQLTIRRSSTGSPPADCGSGTVVTTITSFAEDPVRVYDDTGAVDAEVSYRVCVSDHDASRGISVTAGPITTGSGQKLFMTSGTYTGNLGGFAGANDICEATASGASLEGSWKALLFNGEDEMAQLTWSKIFNMKGEPLGTLLDPKPNGATSAYDEHGESVSGGAWIVGPSTHPRFSCIHWTDESAVLVTVFADPALGPTPLGSGEAVNCNETQRLFCLQSTPIEPPTFDVVTGSSESGDIVATVVLPASVDSYGRIELQRAAGLTAPSDLCSDPSATRSTSWTSFTAGSTLTFTDKGTPGHRYSYRLCVFDSSGRLNYRPSTIGVRAHGAGSFNRIFVSDTDRPADHGLENFDADCAAQASAAGLDGRFLALLSHSDYPGLSRHNILDEIENAKGQIVSSGLEQWDEILNPVHFTLSGAVVDNSVWSGLSASLGHAPNCNDWSVTSGAAFHGTPSEGNRGWFSDSTDICGGNKKFYCLSQPPHALKSFSVAEGAQLGEVAAELRLPTDVSEYASIKVVRIPAGPFADSACANGTVVFASSGPFAPDQDISFTDATGNPLGVYSYRACTFDASAQRIARVTHPEVRPKGPRHTIFITSETWDGNLGGLTGADAKCQAAADAASLSGTYKAVLSDGTSSLRERITINTKIANTNGEIVAESAEYFWTRPLLAIVAYSEDGTEASSDDLFSASSTDVPETEYNCQQFNSADSADRGIYRYGRLNMWGSDHKIGCEKERHLLCISQ